MKIRHDEFWRFRGDYNKVETADLAKAEEALGMMIDIRFKFNIGIRRLD